MCGLNVQSGHCELPTGGEQCSTGTGATEKVAYKVICFHSTLFRCFTSVCLCLLVCNGPGTFGGRWRCGLFSSFFRFLCSVCLVCFVVVVVCFCRLWGLGCCRLVPLVVSCVCFSCFVCPCFVVACCRLFLSSLGAGLLSGWFPLLCFCLLFPFVFVFVVFCAKGNECFARPFGLFCFCLFVCLFCFVCLFVCVAAPSLERGSPLAAPYVRCSS